MVATSRHRAATAIFYNGTLNADTYRRWLDDNAISYVAISQGPYDWSATDEVNLVRRGLPYLKPVWSDQTWTLYAVTNPRPVIAAPGRVVARDAVSLTVSLPDPGEYVVRLHWSRYLTASNGCMRPTEDGWSMSWLNTPALPRSMAVCRHTIVEVMTAIAPVKLWDCGVRS